MNFTSTDFDKSNNHSCSVFNNDPQIAENGNVVSFNNILYLQFY